jgi:hypothetical protein
LTSLVVQRSESLPTNDEVPGSISGSTVGLFLEGDDSRGDHCLGRLVEFRFKAPPGNTSSSITTHTPSGQRNCASWASQPQKSVTLLPCPQRACGGIGGRDSKTFCETFVILCRIQKDILINVHTSSCEVKCKVFPLQARCGPQGG